MERIQDFLASYGRTEPWNRAYVGGTFDVFHRGHLALLANTKKIAHEVVVSVNTDEFAARYKRAPLLPLADRMAVLQMCRLVDHVIVNEGDEFSAETILRSGADCVIHGSDWTGDSLLRQLGLTPGWLDLHRITMVTLPYTAFTSTTQLLAAYEARQGERKHETVRA
jgi:glycerol-3-phosphate cytidylyltransferase